MKGNRDQAAWVDQLIRHAPSGAVAVIDHDATNFSYADLRAMSDALAEILVHEGVREGDRVMVVCENCALMVVAIFALSTLRAWIVPVNARQSRAEIDAILSHSGARLVMFTQNVSEPATAHAKAMAARHAGRLDCGDIILSGPYETTPEQTSDDPHEQVAALMYTTGTTSAPKGGMLTHDNLVWNARVSGEIRRLGPKDVVLAVLPGTHIYCYSSGILSTLAAGATILLQPRFAPNAVLQALGQGVTVLPAVPQMYQSLVNALKERNELPRAPRLRLISAGGAPLDPDWKAEIERLFGLPLHNGYGLTETSPGVAVTRPDAPRKDISVGPAVPDVELRIDQPDSEMIGDLLIRGPNIMKGYYRDADLTERTIRRDGFFRSGDLARVGPEGELYILGRRKELIIRSGFNVYPPEIEAMLTRHDDIMQAAVVGRKVKGNEEILAFLLARNGLSAPSVRDWLHARLAAYKIPQQIVIVDSFPTAPTGKILKTRLIETFADLLDGRATSGEPGKRHHPGQTGNP